MAEGGTEIAQLRSSVIQVEIGGRVYDAVREPKCHTCTHPARIEIEKRILSGHSYRDVAEHYSGTEYRVGLETRVFPRLDWTAIWNHVRNKHMPVEMAAMHQILTQRSRDLSEHYEEETAKIVDGYVFAQQVLRRSQEDLINGTLRPSIQDGLAAAKLIKEMDDDSPSGVDAEIWAQAMTRYFEVAREVMPVELWDVFAARLAADPVLHAIKKRVEAAEQPIDAEYTEETA